MNIAVKSHLLRHDAKQHDQCKPNEYTEETNVLKAIKYFRQKNFLWLIKDLILWLTPHFHQYNKPEFSRVTPDL